MTAPHWGHIRRIHRAVKLGWWALRLKRPLKPGDSKFVCFWPVSGPGRPETGQVFSVHTHPVGGTKTLKREPPASFSEIYNVWYRHGKKKSPPPQPGPNPVHLGRKWLSGPLKHQHVGSQGYVGPQVGLIGSAFGVRSNLSGRCFAQNSP